MQTRETGQSSTHSQSRSPVTLGNFRGAGWVLSNAGLEGSRSEQEGRLWNPKKQPQGRPTFRLWGPSGPARPDAPSSLIPVDLCPAGPKEVAQGLFPVLVLILVPAGQQASCGKAAVRPPGTAPRARLDRKWG